ncbi:uncharacterized protein [Parasteatoda tepidariorum]|uniref:uncharacterized protein n=1 Tax=Parasteatoda tepidariorum TaxID=114398 RepID=UPI00077FDC2E|nr:uncharacterized protein LOC107437525 [Parasteatoda tepidariorum]
MFESRLNPYATSFIPNRKTEVIREMAAKSITELWEKKKANGETTVTNEELAKLVGHFISIGFKELAHSDKVKIQIYINKKLTKVPSVRPISDLCKIRSKLSMKRTKPESFETPNLPFLLVAFWGLYRHEQAQRPLLSLTNRPDALKDKVWSVDASDYKLWNQSCVSKVCKCPPIFGYSIPSDFFGVSFYKYSCSEKEIHLNHYPESTNGNEFLLTNNWHHGFVDEQPFEDIIVDTSNVADVDTLTNQFETIVSGICSILIKCEEDTDSGIEDQEVDEVDFYNSFWDDSPSKVSHVPFSQQNRETLFDDDDHPLLVVTEMSQEQDVSSEVKEMIRKSLTPTTDKFITPFVVDEEKEVCDPPCSIWCDSVKKGNGVEDSVKIPSDLSENPRFKDLVDLVSSEQLYSKKKTEPINMMLKSAPKFCGNKMGDWDPYYYKTNVDIGVTAYASNLITSKEKFTFLQKDAVNSKSYYGSGSWDDSDSGFVSRSSSEDDIFDEICEKDSMWKFVNSEDSLWQPLPECVETNTKIPLPHKRVHDFRCKRSVS